VDTLNAFLHTSLGSDPRTALIPIATPKSATQVMMVVALEVVVVVVVVVEVVVVVVKVVIVVVV